MKTFNEFVNFDSIVEATLSDRILRNRYLKVLRQLDSAKNSSENYRLLVKAQLIATQLTPGGRNKLIIQLK
jgi:hypothetical protein